MSAIEVLKQAPVTARSIANLIFRPRRFVAQWKGCGYSKPSVKEATAWVVS
jgi:hypothetical protein